MAAVGSWLLNGFLAAADVGATKYLAEIFISSERHYRAFRKCGGRLPVGFEQGSMLINYVADRGVVVVVGGGEGGTVGGVSLLVG